MTDHHIHTGWFRETYYNPVEIIEIVMEKCEALCFSSTTSCKENVRYAEVEAEIANTLANIAWPHETVRPFLWYSPDFAKQGVTVENAMRNLPYKGIKIHPAANRWDLSDDETLKIAHSIFEYAGQNWLPVLIHTGQNGVDAPAAFSQFFSLYPKTKFILAHCRPLEETIPLLRDYPNVYGDTAFLPEENIQKIKAENLSRKMLNGSDFPITHYFSSNGGEKNITPREQYNEDFTRLFQEFDRDCLFHKENI